MSIACLGGFLTLVIVEGMCKTVAIFEMTAGMLRLNNRVEF